jgi:hypothetical protein
METACFPVPSRRRASLASISGRPSARPGWSGGLLTATSVSFWAQRGYETDPISRRGGPIYLVG